MNSTPHDHALLAQAGLDLFLSGYVHGGTDALSKESRYPSVRPNLHAIDENTASLETTTRVAESSASSVIVIIGGPVKKDQSPGQFLTNRLQTACTLYRQLMSGSSGDDTIVYVAPTGGDPVGVGVTEADVIRKEVTRQQIPPHHIIMECISNNNIDNCLKLLRVLQHLNLHTVHVVTSEFHLPRIQWIYDTILKSAVSSMAFQVSYHVSPDGLSAVERVERDATEQHRIRDSQAALQTAIRHVKNVTYPTTKPHHFVGYDSQV